MLKKRTCLPYLAVAKRVTALLATALILAVPIPGQRSASSAEKPVSCIRLIDYTGPIVESLGSEPYGFNKVTIGSETRNALCFPVPGRLAHEILVPEAPVGFDFGIGIRSDTAEKSGASVRFRIAVETASAGPQQVFARVLNAEAGADNEWFDCRVDLSAYAGKRASIVMETLLPSSDNRAEGSASCFAAWSNPTVHRLERDESAPNVLIYMIDTLRADHLGVYGYTRKTSPNLDTFARNGILFRSAFSTASWTRPAVASLLTSLYPSFHGAIDRPDVMDDSVTTLSEILLREGYSTAAFVTNPNVLPLYGFAQGFETFGDIEAEQWHLKAGKASELNQAAFEYLERHRDRKFFLYLHSNDPHHPYRPEEPYNRTFARRGDDVGPQAYEKAERLSEADKKRVWESLYDGEIRYNDKHIGDLLRELKRMGLFDDTLIVFVSDHGEEFLDHGGWQHGHTLFDELIHVTLMMKLPSSFAPAAHDVSVDSLVTIMDVIPTILELLEIPRPAETHGNSLFPLIRGDTGGAPQQVICEQNLNEFTLFAVRTPKYKYILRTRPHERKRLYDVEVDPRETKNLIEAESAIADSFQRVVDDFCASSQSGVHLAFTGDGEDRSVSITATAAGGFIAVRKVQCEAEDTAILSENGSKATFSLAIERERSIRPGSPGALQAKRADIDEVILLISENTGPIMLDILLDGNTIDRERVFLGTDGKNPARCPIHIEPNAPELLASALHRPPKPDRKQAACYIWEVPSQQAKRVVELDEKTRERLKALGYIK